MNEKISVLEVGMVVDKMRRCKSSSPMGVVAETLKAADEMCARPMLL